MPTYEYVCEKCGHHFEKFQSIADKPLKTCPEDLCAQKRWGRGRVKKLISAGAGLLFKGSGFYITDYRSEGYQQAAKKESEASGSGVKTGSEGKSDGAKSTEAKPAKAESKSPKPAKK